VWKVKKLEANFIKGFVLFLIVGSTYVSVLYKLRLYLESEVFNGEMPQEYKLIGLGVTCVVLILLAIPTMIRPARAINIEKDRKITEWGITGVKPEDQEMDKLAKQESKSNPN
jgi:hypothetical protein